MEYSPVRAQPGTQLHKDILDAESVLRRSIEESLRQFSHKVEDCVKATTELQIEQPHESGKVGAEKVHCFKQSLLTELMHIKDYKTIYNMVAASFIPLTIMIFVDNLSRYGELLDFNTLNDCFLRLDKVFICWWVLAFVCYTIVPLVYFTVKANLSRWMWITLYLAHQISLLCLPTMFVQRYQPGFGSRMVIMIEGIRMMMKSHSYLRTKLLYCTENSFKDLRADFVKYKEHKMPTFTMGDLSTEIRRFSYYFIAPTLIYRDNYTLTPQRSFSRAVIHFMNFMLCLYYSFIVYCLCCKDVIEMLGKRLTWTQFCLSILRLMLPSMLFLILGFFGFLHSWLNCWAQLTRFPDRVFYLDWWNSVEFGTYYRKWNIVVHDWLYYYVYTDFCRFVLKNNKSRSYSKILTFLLSAVMHELILIEASGFFYPVLFIMFTGPGIILIQNKNKLKLITSNFFFWIELYLGTTLLFVLYLTEYYARSIVSEQRVSNDWGVFNFMVPRTLYL